MSLENQIGYRRSLKYLFNHFQKNFIFRLSALGTLSAPMAYVKYLQINLSNMFHARFHVKFGHRNILAKLDFRIFAFNLFRCIRNLYRKSMIAAYIVNVMKQNLKISQKIIDFSCFSRKYFFHTLYSKIHAGQKFCFDPQKVLRHKLCVDRCM